MVSCKVHIVSNAEALIKDNLMLITGGMELFELVFLKYLAPEVLNAAIIGTRYCAPSSSDIYNFFYKLSQDQPGGILAIIPNGLEEVDNFTSAKLKADFLDIEIVSIGDDCWRTPEYRCHSLAGLTFAFKLAGVMKKSMTLPVIYDVLKSLEIKTVSCHLKKYFSFIGTYLELGTGKFINTCEISDVISEMLDSLLIHKKRPSLYNMKNVVLINCYTSENILLNDCVEEVLKHLKSKDCDIDRVYFGNFMYGPRGFSISFINNISDRVLDFADTSYSNHIWPSVGTSLCSSISSYPSIGPFLSIIDFLKVPLRFACEALLSSEKVFNQLDVTEKFGTSLSKPLDILHKQIEEKLIDWERPCKVFKIISKIFQDSMEDQHGKQFHIFFLGISNAFSSYSKDVPLIGQMWLEALVYGINFLKENAKLQEGDLTFIDVLSPFSSILEHHLATFERDLIDKLGVILNETDVVLQRSYGIESPKKRKGYPEVSTQAVFVALTAIFQGIRSVMNTIKSSEENKAYSCEELFDY